MPNKTICDGDAVGSVDVWKNYLAVGSAELKVVNLDSGRVLQRSSQVSYVVVGSCVTHTT